MDFAFKPKRRRLFSPGAGPWILLSLGLSGLVVLQSRDYLVPAEPVRCVPQVASLKEPPVLVPRQEITDLFHRYLPGCWAPWKQTYWEDWFARGGSMEDFVWTLKSEARRVPAPGCLERQGGS